MILAVSGGLGARAIPWFKQILKVFVCGLADHNGLILKGNPAADTGDFNDQYTGNMRIDYVLLSTTLKVVGCGVFWPGRDRAGHEFIDVSDRHLVWVDIEM